VPRIRLCRAIDLGRRGCAAGCACAIADRIDRTNREVDATNGPLAIADQQLAGALQRLDEMNRRLDVTDRAILRFPGLRPAPTRMTPPLARPVP
jgi:hypothetical protein